MLKQLIATGLGVFFILQYARLCVADANTPATTQPAKADLAVANHPGIEARDPKVDRRLIDLTGYYTLALTEDASGVFGYTLGALPRGVQQLGNVRYDLRGIVQVSSQEFVSDGKKFPKAVKGIPVGLKCQSLSFLHASRWTEVNGRRIGSYVIHYSNGQSRKVPIIFGVDLRDWRPQHDPGAQGNGPIAAWRAQDDAGRDVVLFATAWTNPLPDVQISSIDVVSTMTNAAPFLVAVTAE
jgi:hypothetical protein